MTQPNPIQAEEPLQTAVTEYRPIAAALHDLYTRHAGVIHDCTTTKGMQACREARAEIRTCRTSLEAKRKEIKAPALERCRLIDADAKRITEALLAIEDPLDAQVKAEEEAAEARREAKRKAEMERVARLRRIVEGIRAWPLDAVEANAQELRDLIDGRYAMVFLDLPEEIRQEATEAKDEALRKLREMLAAREAREAQEARLTVERVAEHERQAAEDKRLREERERLEIERQRQEALRQQALREAAAERDRWAKEQAAERAELDRQQAEHARIERELAEERARIAAESVREEASVPWEPCLPSEPPTPSGPSEPMIAFQAEAEPVSSDAVVLRDLAHVLERGGESLALYAWIPNRLQTIAGRLEALEAGPGTTVMRVRFEKLGGHYHCRVFSARQIGQTFAKNGDLVFDEAEWPDIPLLMRGAEFVEEVSEWP